MTHHDRTDDGVHVTRRAVIQGSLAVPAFLTLSHWARKRGGHPLPEADGEAMAGLLVDWAERAAKLVDSDPPNEDAFLQRLAGELSMQEPSAFPERSKVVYEKDGLKTGPVFGQAAFSVIQLDLEPGAVIRAHNHVAWCFLSMGLRGESMVRHFEPEGPGRDPGNELEQDFLVREVQSVLLRPGRTSSLTRARANVHGFRAGEEGATILDFGVQLNDTGDGPRSFSVLDVSPEPTDAERRIYEARWTGNPYR